MSSTRIPRSFTSRPTARSASSTAQQLQRGFQVYKEVCAACHGLSLVAFRDLAALGYEEPEIKAIANQWPIEVPSVNPDTGESATRKAVPSDRFPSPYANETAARAANNNALPPDLSLITKARHDGPAYVHSLLTGYQTPAGRTAEGKFPGVEDRRTGLYYNPYFANLNIAMPPPITSDGQVTYADGTAADGRPDVGRRVGVPDVDRRAQAREPPSLRAGGADLPDRRHDPRLSELSQHLGRGEAQGRAESARSTPPTWRGARRPRTKRASPANARPRPGELRRSGHPGKGWPFC